VETYRFGPFELRPDGTLLREGRPLDLPPKQSGLLRILAGAGGRIVPKQEILDRLWPAADVSEASLTTCVRGLRKALDDRGRRGGHLETVHGSGYRFHASVSARPEGAAAREGVRVAVAPFGCRGAVGRYLAEGLAGEVAAALDRWREEGIEAVARESAERSWGRHPDRVAFADELDLDFLVIGSVADGAQELRVAIELIEVEGGGVEWSQELVGPASGSGSLAAEIAEALAKRLLGPGRVEPRAHVVAPLSADTRAHRAVLRGYFLNQYRDESGLNRSIACFAQAIQWDPRCAAAHAALGEAHLNLGWRGYASPAEIAPLARRALARALAIEPGLALAHAARGLLAALVDRDLRTAEQAFAICAPSASAHDRSAWLGGLVHLAAGRNDDALRVFEAGLVLDPLSPNLAVARVVALWFAGRNEDALVAVRALTEAEPGFATPLALRADLAAMAGRREEALRAATAADALGRGDQMARSGCAWAFGQAGRPEAARALVDAFERRAQSRYVSPSMVAVACAGVGDHEGALRWLARAREAHCMWLPLVPFDPRLAELRRDPRCTAILEEAGLAHRPVATRASGVSPAAARPASASARESS